MEKSQIREETNEATRKATSLSKQSILLLHRKRHSDSARMLSEAKIIITKLQARSNQNLGGMFSAALQEYAEAKILLTLVKEKRFVKPEEISVPSVEYVLGLADVIGELRRLALDYLREGEVEKGSECLDLMDQIFIQLLALDEAYMLVSGLRHKSDTSRRIIEATRGDITLEVRRKALEDQLRKCEDTQSKAKNKKVKKKK